MKLIIVRSGSAIVFSEFGQQPVTVGDVVVLAAHTLCGGEPEGHVTITTVYLDGDYLADQVFWQNVGRFSGRLAARDFTEAFYFDRTQVLLSRVRIPGRDV